MKVNTKINTIHFEADKKLLDYVQDKINKLAILDDKIIEVEVFLCLENTQGTSNKIAEIKLFIPGNELFAKKQDSSFESATTQSVDALKRQIKKHKEKVRGV